MRYSMSIAAVRRFFPANIEREKESEGEREQKRESEGGGGRKGRISWERARSLISPLLFHISYRSVVSRNSPGWQGRGGEERFRKSHILLNSECYRNTPNFAPTRRPYIFSNHRFLLLLAFLSLRPPPLPSFHASVLHPRASRTLSRAIIAD